MSGGFASANVSKLRVINPQESSSLRVESLSSLAPPCYSSSYNEGATSFTTLDQTIMDQPSEFWDYTHNDDSPCIAERPWLEERLPSPYSIEDLPGILSPTHEHLGPAAPSSTYTQSCLLGYSPAAPMARVASCDSHTTPTFNVPSESQLFSSRVAAGHLSTPNFPSQGVSSGHLVYHQTPASQPVISHLIPYQPPPPNAASEPDGEVADSHECQDSRFRGGHAHDSGLRRELSSITGRASLTHLGQGRPTNFVSLSRKSTLKPSTFSFFSSRHHKASESAASITGSFVIDPQLRLPAGLLKAVNSGLSRSSLDTLSAPGTRTRKKNLVLEVENGSINVDIHLTPSVVMASTGRLRGSSTTTASSVIPHQPEPRRSTDKRYLHPDREQQQQQQGIRRSYSQLGQTQEIPTRIEVRLKEGASTPSSAKRKLIARVNAPSPRLPLHILASTINEPPTPPPKTSTTINSPSRSKSRRLQSRSHHRKFQSKSPVFLHLPRTLHGPLTIHIAAGNIDEHVRLSKELSSIAVILNENALSRGYFVSSRGLAQFAFDDDSGDPDPVEDAGWVLVEGPAPEVHGDDSDTRPSRRCRDDLAMVVNGRPQRNRDEGWYGDKVDVIVGDGMVYLQFIDEEDPFGRQKGFWQGFGLGCW